MSWDSPTPMTREEMTRKVQEVLSGILEDRRAITVSELGEFDDHVLNYWVEEFMKHSFKILRHAKAASLLMDHRKVDKTHIDTAIKQIAKTCEFQN